MLKASWSRRGKSVSTAWKAAATTRMRTTPCLTMRSGWSSSLARHRHRCCSGVLRIGYGRAAHLIDLMERDGLVGPADGSRPRELLKAPGWLHEISVLQTEYRSKLKGSKRNHKAQTMLGIGEKHELPTILLIDDDLVSREVIATVLTLHGHMVQTRRPGRGSRWRCWRQAPFTPDVMLMDAQLPGLSGADLIEQLRERARPRSMLISGSQPAETRCSGRWISAEAFWSRRPAKELVDAHARSRRAGAGRR